jgi:hypothetical protein
MFADVLRLIARSHRATKREMKLCFSNCVTSQTTVELQIETLYSPTVTLTMSTPAHSERVDHALWIGDGGPCTRLSTHIQEDVVSNTSINTAERTLATPLYAAITAATSTLFLNGAFAVAEYHISHAAARHAAVARRQKRAKRRIRASSMPPVGPSACGTFRTDAASSRGTPIAAARLRLATVVVAPTQLMVSTMCVEFDASSIMLPCPVAPVVAAHSNRSSCTPLM